MSELREAIARAIGSRLEQEGYTLREDDGDLFADRYAGDRWQHIPVDPLADAALAAIEARGMVVVPAPAVAVALDRLAGHWDEGPEGEGWQSDELAKAIRDIMGATAPARTED